MGHVYLESEADVRTLHHLVSQYQSWKVEFALHLTELGCDDWKVLAELLPRLTRVGYLVDITTNSTIKLSLFSALYLLLVDILHKSINDKRN